MTLEELYEEAKRLSFKYWGVAYDGEIKLVNRKWSSYNGYIRATNVCDKDGNIVGFKNYEIVLSKKRNAEHDRDWIAGILLHELVHWRLMDTGKPFRDHEEEFVKECLRVGAPFSGTKTAQQAKEKYESKTQRIREAQ